MSVIVAEEGDAAARRAEQHGLRRMGVRPPLGEYLKSVWTRRKFMTVLARSKVYAENQNMYLGQFWALINPIMNAAVYVLIFGVVIGTREGLENFVGYIVVGTFLYRFFSESVTGAARSIPSNHNLVRSLHFPRAVLPLSSVYGQVTTLGPAIAVMAFFTVISDRFMVHTNVTPNWRWLLIVPAVVLLYLFSTGVGFILARICAAVPDVLNLLPFLLRLGMYASGVLFSIDHFIKNPTMFAIMEYQPVALYLNLGRQAMLEEPSAVLDPMKWLIGTIVAIVFFIVGFIVFWRDEARYGRD